MSHKDNLNEPPCRHMEKMLHEAASDRSRGLQRWYTLAHAARCGRCGRFLAALRGMVGTLRVERSNEPTPDMLERLADKVRQSAP